MRFPFSTGSNRPLAGAALLTFLPLSMAIGQEETAQSAPVRTPVTSTTGVAPRIADEGPLRDGIDGGTGRSLPAVHVDDQVPLPTKPRGIASDQGDVVVAPATGNPYFLSFAAGPYFPADDERIDPQLLKIEPLRIAPERPTKETYAFVMLQRRLTPELVGQFEDLGVRVLGFHPHHALRVAIEPARVELIAQHPAVRWVGLPREWQKVHPALERLLQAAKQTDVVDVIVTVYESDENPATSWVPLGNPVAQEIMPGGVTVERLDLESAPKLWMSNGWQQRAIQERGIVVDEYIRTPSGFRCRLQPHQVDLLLDLDFVQFVEPDLPDQNYHDESSPLIGADFPRASYPGNTNNVAVAGIIDSGVETGSGTSPAHLALNHTFGVGWDLVSSTSAWDDPCGHGSHVAGTMWAKPPAAEAGYTGMAPDLGSSNTLRLRNVKIFPGTVYNSCGTASSSHDSRYSPMRGTYTDGSGNVSQRPHVVNNSWGSSPSGGAWIGTESTCVTLDAEVWDHSQLYCFSSGNDGSGAGTVGRPGIAKNAFTVGNVVDYNSGTVGLPGNLWTSSSRGPAGDGRWKPNVTAPGRQIRSVDSRTGTNQNLYTNKSGTSMASPHVAGVAAQLADHYSWLRYAPHRMASLLMATASTKDNQSISTPSDTHLDEYGTGRINATRAHFVETDWTWTNWSFTQTNSWHYADFTVAANCERLVVCMTYHEPEPSTGAGQSLIKDIDLWLDRDPVDPAGNTGEYFIQQSSVDNTEIRHVLSPAAGPWRWKTWPVDTSGSARVSVTVYMITSDDSPSLSLSVTASDSYVQPNETVDVTATSSPSDFMAHDVFLNSSTSGSGLTLESSTTTLKDGLATNLMDNEHGGFDVVLGNTEDDSSRSATWGVRWSTEGVKTWTVDASSDNAGSANAAVNVTVDGTAPPIPTSLSSSSHTLNGWSNSPNITFTFNQAADNLSGVEGYGEHLTTGTPGPGASLDFTGGSPRTVTVAADGQWRYGLRAVDRSGNWSGSTSAGWYGVDRVLPGSVTNLRSTSHTPGAWSNDPSIDLAWNAANDDRSGVDGYGEAWSTANPVGVGAAKDLEETATTRTITVSSNSSGWNYALRTVDNAGNWSTTPVQVGPFLIDAVAPSGPTGLSSSSHTPGPAWSSNGTVTVQWTSATDAHSGLLGYDTRWDQSATTTLTGALDTAAGVTSASRTLSGSTNGWYFHIAARDVAGNYGPTQHIGPFFIDTTAPAVRMEIDGGAPTTTSLAVNLTIQAADVESGLRDMRFRNDGGAFSPWEPFAANKAWTLDAFGGSNQRGTRTVQVEVRNRAALVGSASDDLYFFVAVNYFGSSCTGALGLPTFQIQGVPGLNRTIVFQVGNTAASTLVLELGASRTNWLGIPLPLNLAFAGSPGCFVNVSPDIAFYSGGVAPVPVTIPNDPAITGIPIYHQGLLFGDPSGTPIITTRGAEVVISGL